MTDHKFVHLLLHTEYSLIDSVVRIKPLMRATSKLGMPAIALTDQCNLFALVKFYKAALQNGIKPIIGTDVQIIYPEEEMSSRLIIMAQNNKGYRNLTRLISKAYLDSTRKQVNAPAIHYEWLKDCNEGLLAISGGHDDVIGRSLLKQQINVAESYLTDCLNIFKDRFYLNLQRTGKTGETEYLRQILPIAQKHGVPVVATNDIRFLTANAYEAHEARVCIHDGNTLTNLNRDRRYTSEQYLKSQDEMIELFSDIPEAIENTIEISKRCTVSLKLGSPVLPSFPIPSQVKTEEYLREQATAGLEKKFTFLFESNGNLEENESKKQIYRDRLERELQVIITMKFPGYFLIVSDFIQWAKNNGIPVGPGRGSGAGSLVAYALEITDLDPIKYDLLFERFLNPERVSMPDFDVDFCMEGRDKVIEYVAQRYGRDQVSQIITFGTMAAKAVVRDVGRVLGHPYGYVDRIAKMIPFEIGMTLAKALQQEEELRKIYNEDEEVKTLIDLAQELEGLCRNAGKHAGGVVIAPTPLTDFTPLYCEESGDSIVTQLDKDDVEAIGLVKFDFLGLRTLTIIDWAIESINQNRLDTLIDINRIPLDDVRTFQLLKNHETKAVFQLESSGMQELIDRLQPDHFEDIIALVALYRPGPLQSGMVDDFINRKHGLSKVEYPHPDLEAILKPTYGVILYQEQVMQIAQVLAGYTLGGADLLRRAMGKKKPEEMAKQRDIFLKGAQKRGVEKNIAMHIFDLMEKFAGYGFNKSHSAAYALLSYQTAWLKAHYASAFMAAVMSADMDNTDKVVSLIEECKNLHIEVLSPDINHSEYKFYAKDETTIFYGLGAIKGVGESAISVLIADRQKRGKYSNLQELCERVIGQKITRKVLEVLIRAGALDSIGCNRATLFHDLAQAIARAERLNQDGELGQIDFFGSNAHQQSQTPDSQIQQEWPEFDRLRFEKETLGLYLTGHPITPFLQELRKFVHCPLEEFVNKYITRDERVTSYNKTQSFILAGLITTLSTKRSANGKFAFITLDDKSARIEIGVFGEEFRTYHEQLKIDNLVIVEAEMSYDHRHQQRRLRAKKISTLDDARKEYATHCLITITEDENTHGNLQKTYKLIRQHQGQCPVFIQYYGATFQTRLRLSDEWNIIPCQTIIDDLKEIWDSENIEISYNAANNSIITAEIA